MKAGQKILLIQLFSNGDCLLATPLARQLKNDNPETELTWMVSSKCRNMLLHNPDIDKIEEINIADAAQNLQVFEETVSKARAAEKAGIYDKVIVPQLLGSNMQYYDGTVCSSLFRAAGLNLTVDTHPVLQLTDAEQAAARNFAETYQLAQYRNVVLFECAPQTSQLDLSDEKILHYSQRVIKEPGTCIILSGPRAYNFQQAGIIDGNTLSIRETVALTHYCSLLLGCSSGISWAATSTAAKPLPTVQLLDTGAYYFNPLSLTFKKLNRPANTVLELTRFDEMKLEQVFGTIFKDGFETAWQQHQQPVQPQFRLYRGIVHNFLKKGKFAEIATFVKVNIRANGWNTSMLKYMLMGIVLFPLQWITDKVK